MRKPRTNCFTIASGLPLRMGMPVGLGIQVLHNESCQVVDLGLGRVLELSAQVRPRVIKDMVMRGTIYTAPHTQRRLISGTKPDDECLLLRIVCRDLTLAAPVLSPNLGLRAGGFAIDVEPIIESSVGKARDRQQLYMLKEGKSIYLADVQSRVMRIECCEGRYVIHAVSAEEIATYFMDQARHDNTPESYDQALQRTRHLIQAGHEGVRPIRHEILKLQKAA